MRAGIDVKVTRADRHRFEAIVSDRSAPQKHVWRAHITLATADGCGTTAIMRRCGVFRSVLDLQTAINRFVTETGADPKPFVWTADPKRVLAAAVKRGKQMLESIH